MAAGTAILDFGPAPGSNTATVTVTGQGAILAGSHVEAFIQAAAADATVDHNAYEHAMVPMFTRATNIVASTGFDIFASCEWLLTGTFTVHWVWL
jgi:hypothetical protein